MTDIRLDTNFFKHPKTRKLYRTLGAEGVLCLIKLWCEVRNLRPNGELEGFDPEDLEDIVEWRGESGVFVKELLERRFLVFRPTDEVGETICPRKYLEFDNGEPENFSEGYPDPDPQRIRIRIRTDEDFDFLSHFYHQKRHGFLIIHDWIDHNPWAAGSFVRSDRGTFLNLKRWHPKLARSLEKIGIDKISKDQYNQLLEADPEGQRILLESIASGKKKRKPKKKNAFLPLSAADPSADPHPDRYADPPYHKAMTTDIKTRKTRKNRSLAFAPKSSAEPPAETFSDSDENQDSIPPPPPELPTTPKPKPRENRNPPCPYQRIVRAFETTLPELTPENGITLTDELKRSLKRIWEKDAPEGERFRIEFFQDFWQYVRQSEFLMGKRTDFIASFPWLIGPKNFSKTINGQYHNRAAFHGRSAREIRNAQACLDFVNGECQGGDR